MFWFKINLLFIYVHFACLNRENESRKMCQPQNDNLFFSPMLFYDILSEIFYTASENKAVGSEMQYALNTMHPGEEIHEC